MKVLVAILLTATLGFCQELLFIDTTSWPVEKAVVTAKHVTIHGYGGGILTPRSAGRSESEIELKLRLVEVDAVHRQVTLDVVLTNTGKLVLVTPVAPSRSALTEGDSSAEYLAAALLIRSGKSETPFIKHLYGSEKIAGSTIQLRPRQSIRVRIAIPFPLQIDSEHPQKELIPVQAEWSLSNERIKTISDSEEEVETRSLGTQKSPSLKVKISSKQ